MSDRSPDRFDSVPAMPKPFDVNLDTDDRFNVFEVTEPGSADAPQPIAVLRPSPPSAGMAHMVVQQSDLAESIMMASVSNPSGVEITYQGKKWAVIKARPGHLLHPLFLGTIVLSLRAIE